MSNKRTNLTIKPIHCTYAYIFGIVALIPQMLFKIYMYACNMRSPFLCTHLVSLCVFDFLFKSKWMAPHQWMASFVHTKRPIGIRLANVIFEFEFQILYPIHIACIRQWNRSIAKRKNGALTIHWCHPRRVKYYLLTRKCFAVMCEGHVPVVRVVHLSLVPFSVKL